MVSLVQDPWSPLSYKAAIGDSEWGAALVQAQGWARGHGRRLHAYTVLRSYLDNSSRHFSTAETNKEKSDRREYGEASLLVEQIVSALLGDDQTIVLSAIAEVSTLDPDSPDLTDEDREKLATAERAQVRLDELLEWAEAEKFKLKIIENEENAVALGDGVYVLGLSHAKRRAQLRVYNPQFYFPIVQDESAGDYPSRVHMAWEVVESDGQWEQIDSGQPNPPELSNERKPRRLRRITYELRTLDTPIRYPWQDAEEEPSTVACFMTDGVWDLDTTTLLDDLDTTAPGLYLRNEEGEEIRNLNLGIDMIPIVHVPNTPSFQNHFGRSSLSPILQLLDDIQNADTDKSEASDLASTPAIGLSGVSAGSEIETYGPGTVLNLGQDGKVYPIDTSPSLGAIQTHVNDLLDRLAVNARVPESALGKIKGQIPSGVALALSFGPLQSMIQKMRLVRDDKYSLLFKFVQKFAIAGGFTDDSTIYEASLAMGAFLPVDKAAAVDQTTQLLQAHAISRKTAVNMLIEVGFPIEDAEAELQAIQREDFDGADSLLAATGDEDAVFDYLGREKPERPTRPAPPTPNSPPTVALPNLAPPTGDEQPEEEE